jgi:site-specific DNA recombinase
MTSTELHRRTRPSPRASTVVRVALYTRKSSEKGLDSAYSSVDHQRQILEAYVTTRAAQGWITIPQRYDDGGFSGGNTKRPGLQQLLADVKAGLVDAVACYRLDRLSRDTGDFIQLMGLFKSYGVAVVSPNESVEQATASDRLNLGVRMQVSQFEREIAAERITDKMRGARRRGLWQGGRPVLGYDVLDKRLVVNDTEAALVREVFDTYLRLGSLTVTLDELKRRAISNKRWRTIKGGDSGGRPFSQTTLRHLLSNRLYRGELQAGGGEWVQGEHKAIVPHSLWNRVQVLLAGNDDGHDRSHRAPSGAVLQSILRCGACGSAMTPSHARKGSRKYLYYTCLRLKQHGATACPGSRVSAGKVEAEVIEYLQRVAREPAVIAATVKAAHREVAAERRRLATELRRHEDDVRRLHAERVRLLQAVAKGESKPVAGRLAEVETAAEEAAQRCAAVREEILALRDEVLDEDALRAVLEAFEPVWAELAAAERTRVLALLLERVSYDGSARKIELAFRSGGARDLSTELAPTDEEPPRH